MREQTTMDRSIKEAEEKINKIVRHVIESGGEVRIRHEGEVGTYAEPGDTYKKADHTGNFRFSVTATYVDQETREAWRKITASPKTMVLDVGFPGGGGIRCI